VLADVVNPLITLPRDLVRYIGTVNVSWSAVGEEVDFTDLLAIEALRLFRFPVHQAIRSRAGMLCGTGGGFSRGQNAAYDAIFLSSAKSEQDKEYLQNALKRLFPRLESVWGNTHYDSSSELRWRAQRLICHPRYFPSYFRLSLGNDIIPRKTLNALISKCDDQEFVQQFFRERSRAIRKDGHSEVPIVLEDLTGAPEGIPSDKLPSFLNSLFGIVDELDSEGDDERGFGSFGSNPLRVHWLLNELVRARFAQTERSALLRNALSGASLGWRIDLTRRIRSEHWPRDSQSKTAPEQRLVDEETASELMKIAVTKIKCAAESGELLNLRHFTQVLFCWGEFSGSYAEVKDWTDKQLGLDAFVIRIANAVTSTAWVTSLGDRVSRGVPSAHVEGLKPILDTDRLLARISEIERKPIEGRDREIIERFREGMRRNE
jgi:predicted KAP-like P-loop ATPase